MTAVENELYSFGSLTGTPDGGFAAVGLNGLSAFDQNGNRKWTASVQTCIDCLLSVDQAGTAYVPMYSNQRTFISGTLVAVNASGTRKWEVNVSGLAVAVSSDSIVYFTGVPSNSVGATPSLYAIHKATGAIVWQVPGFVANRLLLDESRNLLYMVQSGGLLAFDLVSRQQRWKIEKLGVSAALGPDGTLFMTPQLTAVSPDGLVKWTADASGCSCFSPLVDDKGNVYVVAMGTRATVSAYTAAGALLWRYTPADTSQITFADPVIDADNNVYVVERFDPKAAWAITPINGGVRGNEVASVDAGHGRMFLINRQGRVFYNDRGGRRLQFFDTKGFDAADAWPLLGGSPERTGTRK